jgi:opacity protein-like surface antigen
MKMKKLILILALVTIFASVSWAQRFEIMPFAGYRTNGSFRVSALDYAKFTIKDGFAYGITLAYTPSTHAQVEIMWSRTDSHLSGELTAQPKADTDLFKLHTDQFHVNFMPMFPQANGRFTPYLLFGVGLTYAKPSDVSGETRFSWSIGGGVKVMAGERIGFRFQAKWAPTYISTTSGGIWCDWWGYCYAIPVSNYMNQGEFTGGVFFRF